MRRSIGLLGVLVAASVAGYLYIQQAKSTGREAGNPRTVVDVTAVKMELLNMAQAERAYMAREGHYASLDDLKASGDIVGSSSQRGQYAYSATYDDKGFTITATYDGPPNPGAPATMSVDQDMNVQ